MFLGRWGRQMLCTSGKSYLVWVRKGVGKSSVKHILNMVGFEPWFMQACYCLRDLAADMWGPCLPGSNKDYIALPKDSGYQSLHLTVALEPPAVPGDSLPHPSEAPMLWPSSGGPTVELQFRTQRTGLFPHRPPLQRTPCNASF